MQKEWYEPIALPSSNQAYGGCGGAGRGRDMVKPSWRGETGLLPEGGAQLAPQLPTPTGAAERPPQLLHPGIAAGQADRRGEDAFVTNDPWSPQPCLHAQTPQLSDHLGLPYVKGPSRVAEQPPAAEANTWTAPTPCAGPGKNVSAVSGQSHRPPGDVSAFARPAAAEPPPGHAAAANAVNGSRDVNQAPRPAAPGATEQPKASAPPLAAGLRPAPVTSAAAADTRIADDRGASTTAQRSVPRVDFSGPRPWKSEEWAEELLAFANATSVELHIIELTDSRVSNGLACSSGEVVAAVSKQSDDLTWCVVYRDGARHEGAVPRSICQRPSTYEFYLRLVVAGGERLGLGGAARPQGLQVEAVRPGGLIALWNDGCARTFFRNVVRVGDVIVCANDVREPARMLDEMQKSSVVQLFIRRYGD